MISLNAYIRIFCSFLYQQIPVNVSHWAYEWDVLNFVSLTLQKSARSTDALVRRSY